MLKKENRITTNEFRKLKRLKDKGIKKVGKYFIMKYYNLNAQSPKFGIVISRKIYKNAVQRNKVKRRLKASIISNIENFVAGYYIIIQIKSGQNILEYDKICSDVNKFIPKDTKPRQGSNRNTARQT